MDELLLRVQKKVADGEQLTLHELQALERAAEEQPGPGLKVAYAQALLNADEAERAHALLAKLRRDFPNDGPTLLASARALVCLERWGPAETVLQELHRVNPSDPEVLKALATLALRRGEVARARELTRRALQGDPLDGEAQLLDTELEHTGAAPVSRDDFVEALVRQLTAQSTPHLLQQGELLVRLGQGGVARLDLDSHWEEHRHSGRALTLTVETLARDLAERALGLPAGPSALLEQVLPVLRDERFLERGEGSVRREGPAGLWVFYVLEHPELMRYVPEQVLQRQKLSLDELDAAAWRRLERLPTPVRPIALEAGQLRLSESPTGLWALAAADGHDAARLLTAAQQELITQAMGESPLRVYLGLRELVLLCRAGQTDCVAQLQGLDATKDGIPGAFHLENRRLVALKGSAP